MSKRLSPSGILALLEWRLLRKTAAQRRETWEHETGP